MLSLKVLACASHKFSVRDGSSRHAPRRTQVRPTDIKRAIQHAKNICYNFEDTPECRSAWEQVEELSSELARQADERSAWQDEASGKEYDV
jgi:hypothetical protein